MPPQDKLSLPEESDGENGSLDVSIVRLMYHHMDQMNRPMWAFQPMSCYQGKQGGEWAKLTLPISEISVYITQVYPGSESCG